MSESLDGKDGEEWTDRGSHAPTSGGGGGAPHSAFLDPTHRIVGTESLWRLVGRECLWRPERWLAATPPLLLTSIPYCHPLLLMHTRQYET